MWTPQAPAEQTTHLSMVLDVIDKVTKILAVVIGSGWAYLNYIRGRTFKRRLEPSISGKTIRSKGSLLLSGVAMVKNVGLSKVPIQQKGTAIEVLSHVIETPSGEAPKFRLTEESVAVREVFKVHGWIEPGEQIEESFLILTPDNGDTVAFGLCLRIVSEHIEWNADSIVEIIPIESSSILASDTALAPQSTVFSLRAEHLKMTIQAVEDKKRTEEIENKKHHQQL